ncbi:GNAT family N-acetyltransferase [Blastococcus sp. TML/M2B]|uniref:GNAT family N-acetyltransferase n=1 Tax=unclassified Blastococcus TaxID=2619396 RepID=UPI00190CB13E|nr:MULTISPECIES: N-acetyltransferase [unclassified Blastococcus]MBN1092570.1 GNAT family N-acetyltransferase [Blastococcus sp. TML/M2B]MBN1097336.1 GNAT family N-acetyltransferase [Blastococcus sp. TML/C7B]
MLSIRPAVTADGPRLVELDRATWSPENAVAPLRDDAADFFERRPPDDVLVAEDDGAVVGYTQFGRPTPLASNEHVLHIQGLAVAPSARRQGVARQLLEAAAAEAARRGIRKLGLRVLGGNTAARTLYESAGFVVEGVLREEFWLDGRYVDDVLMARRLT